MKRAQTIILPAFEPDRRMLDTVIELQTRGFEQIVVVDDGSGAGYGAIFTSARTLGAVVAVHPQNRGKGAAIRTGIETAREHFGIESGFITVDADGQHRAADVERVADAMDEHPNCLILGTRDFSGDHVPWKSRWGNRIASILFRIFNGKSCPDTQTGLRGIPSNLTILALSEDGDRYDYEMNFLTDASAEAPMRFVPIATIYENENASSHFRPFLDSLLIYGRPLRFVMSSGSGAACDYLLFYLFTLLIALPHAQMILVSTMLARFASGFVNFEMNRHFSFQSRGNVRLQAGKYFVLFVAQMMASAAGVTVLPYAIPAIAAKLIVDTGLFFLSYVIQKRWIFGKGKGTVYEKKKTSLPVGNPV